MTDPSQERGAQPKVSPDGKWVWDGHNWVENPHPAPPQQIPEYPEPFKPAEPSPTSSPSPGREPPGPPGPPVGGRPGMTYPVQNQPRPPVIAPTPPYTPVKKSNALRNIVLSCAVLSILMVAGCAVFITVAVKQVGDEVNKQIDNATVGGTSTGQEVSVQEGDRFDLDGLRYRKGWKFTANELGMLEVKRLTFTNVRNGTTTVVLSMDVLRAGETVATVLCQSGQVASGTVGQLTCVSADQLPQQYDEIRVTDLF